MQPDPFSEWRKAEPASPEQPMRAMKFAPPQQCGQGPYRFEVETLGAQYSESLHVSICTAHGFAGSFSYQAPGYTRTEGGVGEGRKHHERCLVDTVVAKSGGTGTKAGGTAAPPRGKVEPATVKPVAVELRGEVIETGTKCPTGTWEYPLISHGYTIHEDPKPDHAPPLRRGPFTMELWSDLPNDLTGAVVIVEQRAVPSGYDHEAWITYRRAWRAWRDQYDEKLALSRAQGHKWRTVDPIAATKQPPPARAETPPPKPSPNAAWIPGYWQFTDGWLWSAGFWRVPQQDIEQEKTVEAPTAPPAPKVEVAPDATYYSARKAVWTPGHWMWTGTVYLWIPGAWRIPDGAAMQWVAPTWRPTRRGTLIYVPGGFVRIGPRR